MSHSEATTRAAVGRRDPGERLRVASLHHQLGWLVALVGLMGCDHARDLDRIERELQTSGALAGSGGVGDDTASEGGSGGNTEPPDDGPTNGGTGATTPLPPLAPPMQDPLTLEPNDTFLQAAPLTLDQPYPYVSLEEERDEVDYYTVPVALNDTYTLDILNESYCSLYYEVRLGADGSGPQLASGGTIRSGNTTSHVVEELEAPAAGNALISITIGPLSGRCSRYAVTVYRSTLAGLEHDSFSLEPNDSPSTAPNLEYGRQQTSLALTELRDTIDYYRFPPAVAGSRHSLIINNPRACSLYYTLSVERGADLSPVIGPANSRPSLGSANRTEINETGAPTVDGPLLLAIESALDSYSCDTYDVLLQPAE